MTESRVGITLSAFQQLAHYLSGYPGRKNLIWVSGSFPIVLFPDANLLNPAVAPQTYMRDIQRTADLCTAAQIAIYPVSAEGLMIHSVYQADASAISEQSPACHEPEQRRSDELRIGRCFVDTSCGGSIGEEYGRTGFL